MNAFLIWSNQHGMWWRPARRGYTAHIEEAGRYTRTEADAIVNDATVGGLLGIQRTDPVTGREYRQFTEVVVPAPDADEQDDTSTPSTPIRVGLTVDSSNGAHVRFRVFAATGGAHLGGCGHLVMRTDEYAAFRALLEPALTDRPDPADEAVTSR